MQWIAILGLFVICLASLHSCATKQPTRRKQIVMNNIEDIVAPAARAANARVQTPIQNPKGWYIIHLDDASTSKWSWEVDVKQCSSEVEAEEEMDLFMRGISRHPLKVTKGFGDVAYSWEPAARYLFRRRNVVVYAWTTIEDKRVMETVEKLAQQVDQELIKELSK